MHNISQELLENCNKWLLEKSNTWNAEVCRGTAFVPDETNKVVPSFTQPHGACHSWVVSAYNSKCFAKHVYSTSDWSSVKYKEDAENFIILNCVSPFRSKNICSAESLARLTKWMARESPFSEHILNRDDDKSLEEGGVVLWCGPDGLSLAECMWVCKVLRFGTEGGKACETFKTLVDGGVDGMLAIYIASHIRAINGAQFSYSGVDSHSTVFRGSYSNSQVDSVKALLLRKKKKNASNTGSLFHDNSLLTSYNPVTKVSGFCKPFKKPDGWGGFIEGSGADKESLVKQALEWQQELEAEIKQVEKPVDTSGVFLNADL